MHSHSLRNYPSYFASFLSSQGCQSLFCCWPTRFALQVFLIGFWDNCSLPILSGRFANKAQLPFPSLHRLKKDFQGLPRLRGFGASAGDTWGWLAFLLWEGPCARPKQGFFLLKKKKKKGELLTSSAPSPTPKCPLFLLFSQAIQVLCAKENNEPVCGVLLRLAICVHCVRYIESNWIYNTIMVLIVGPIYS